MSSSMDAIARAEQLRDRAAVALADAVIGGYQPDIVEELTAAYGAALDRLGAAWKAWEEA